MKTLFDADVLMENPKNFVKAERLLNIIPNNPYYVEHSIYFAQSLTVFKDALRTERLILGLDYEYNALDSIASEQSNKDCYRAILFLKAFPILYIDYHSYGDIISADLFNNVSNNINSLNDTSAQLSEAIQTLTKILAEHKANTKPHGAAESIVPLSVPLRTETGTLKAADAKENSDLTPLSQTKTEINNAKNEMYAKLTETKNKLTHHFNTKIEELKKTNLDIENIIAETEELKKRIELLSTQNFESPIGEVKIFYEDEYKHGFLEANGLPFSPDVFPEFTAYVKKVWNTGTDQTLGWPLRPKLEKPDYPIGEVLIAYDKEYRYGFLQADGLPFSPDVFPEFAAYVKKVWNTGTDQTLGWPLRPVITKDDGTFVFIRACQTAKNDGSHYFIKAIQGV